MDDIGGIARNTEAIQELGFFFTVPRTVSVRARVSYSIHLVTTARLVAWSITYCANGQSIESLELIESVGYHKTRHGTVGVAGRSWTGFTFSQDWNNELH